MLAITSRCDRPGCEGRVEFEMPPPDANRGRLLGRCDDCHTIYSLYGGIRRAVAVAANPRRGGVALTD